MFKASWLLLASLLACGDSIGSVACEGTACAPSQFRLETLEIDFIEVATSGAAPLPAFTWSLGCMDACSSDPGTQLYWAGDDRTWNVARAGALPTVELIEGDGARSTQQLAQPTGTSQLVRSYAVGQPDGTLLVHALWAQPRTSQEVEEVALFSSGSAPVRATMSPLAQERQLGAIRGGNDSYLLFDDNLANGMLVRSTRLVGADGKRIWLAGDLPELVPFVGGSAVWTSQQYVLAGRGETNSVYYLMWFDTSGVLQRATNIKGSNWRNAQLLDAGGGTFLAVARTDLEAGNVPTPGSPNSGMIDAVLFDGATVTTGWRLERDCLYQLEVLGYAVSPSHVFISTLIGDANESRGLLCSLPRDGSTPRCFQAEPGQTLGALVAIGPKSVVAAMNREIVRIDLP